ncbi:MAG: TadE family protein [Sphingomicrobium sp.]
MFTHLRRDRSGAAAAEMALVLPLLLIIMMGSMELGNYFLDEHILVKAVRDGARFAARQSFTNYTCSTTIVDPTVIQNTQNVVMTGLVSGGTNRLADWQTTEITVSTRCDTTTSTGIYKGSTGAPIVIVDATMNYVPILHSYGFTGFGSTLKARQEAAVAGI